MKARQGRMRLLNKTCKIVELMDDVRDKDKLIDDNNEIIKALQDKEKDLNIELERAAGVIKQLEVRVTLSEKERSKEAKLRKEEQARLLELIDDKQKSEIKLVHQKSSIESISQQFDELKAEQLSKDSQIASLKDELKLTKDELNMQCEITGAKSETIRDYERRVEVLTEQVSELKRHNQTLQSEVDTMKNEIYESK